MRLFSFIPSGIGVDSSFTHCRHCERSNPVFVGVRKKVWITAPASPARNDEFDRSEAITAGIGAAAVGLGG